MTLPVSEFSHKQDNVPKEKVLEWSDLAQKLEQHKQLVEKDNAGLFSVVHYKQGSKRALANVATVHALVIDFDNGAVPIKTVEERLQDWEHVIYTTHNHTEAKPKFRVVLPFRVPMDAATYSAKYDQMASAISDAQHDKGCKDASRFWFWPSCPPGAAHYAKWNSTGEFYDWQDLPEEAPAVTTRTPEVTRNGLLDHQARVHKQEMSERLLHEAVGQCSSKGRNNSWFWFCCQMRDNDYSESDADSMLNRFMAAVPKGSQPFTEQEARATLRSAYSRHRREPLNSPKTKKYTPLPDDEEAPTKTDVEQCSSLEDVAKITNRLLNKKADRLTKQRVAHLIGDYLVSKGKLLKDTSTGESSQSYIRTDAGATIKLTGGSERVKAILHDAGINATEPVYEFVIEELVQRCREEGTPVTVHKWSTFKDGKLYVSSGSAHMVVCTFDKGQPHLELAQAGVSVDQAQLELCSGGTDGVMFAEEACFPSWEPVPIDQALRPQEVQALNPLLEAPAVSAYTPEVQQLLLNSLLSLILQGGTPRPILVAIGSKGGGKSTLMRAIARLIMGAAGGIANVPTTPKDFNSAICAQKLYVIDNLDSKPDKFLADSIAQAFTGEFINEKVLYKQSDVLMKVERQAFLMVTTRTAEFAARRSDIQERIVPLFFGDRQAGTNADEARMNAEVLRKRDAVLTWLVIRAAARVAKKRDGFKARAQNHMAKIADMLMLEGATEQEAVKRTDEIGRALNLTQQGEIQDMNPFLQELLTLEEDVIIRGRPVEIYSELVKRNEELTAAYQERNGKRAAREMREWFPLLDQEGITCRQVKSSKGTTTEFTFQRRKQKG